MFSKLFFQYQLYISTFYDQCSIFVHRFGDPGIEKDIDITVTVRTDYQYAKEIGILFAVSLLGIIIPFLARAIFDVENTNFEGLKLKHW